MIISFIAVSSFLVGPVGSLVNAKKSYQSAILSESVLLSCENVQLEYYWKQGERILNVGTYIVNDQFSKTFVLFKNFSLLIKSASLSDEGLYYCGNNWTRVSVHKLSIYGMIKFRMLYFFFNWVL